MKRVRIRDDGAMAKRRCRPSLTRCPLRGRNCCRPRNAGHKSSSDTHHDEEPVVRSSAYFYTYGVYFIFKSMEQGATFRVSVPKYPTNKDPNHRILARQR